MWQPKHDRHLLLGVLRHGYGNWGLVVRDASLGLLSVLQLEAQALISEDTVAALQALPSQFVLSLGDSDEPGKQTQCRLACGTGWGC